MKSVTPHAFNANLMQNIAYRVMIVWQEYIILNRLVANVLHNFLILEMNFAV